MEQNFDLGSVMHTLQDVPVFSPAAASKVGNQSTAWKSLCKVNKYVWETKRLLTIINVCIVANF